MQQNKNKTEFGQLIYDFQIAKKYLKLAKKNYSEICYYNLCIAGKNLYYQAFLEEQIDGLRYKLLEKQENCLENTAKTQSDFHELTGLNIESIRLFSGIYSKSEVVEYAIDGCKISIISDQSYFEKFFDDNI